MNPKTMFLQTSSKILFLVAVGAFFSVSLGAAPDTPPLLGFKTESAQQERELEKKFDTELHKEEMAHWMEYMAAHPHHLGSKYGEELVAWVRLRDGATLTADDLSAFCAGRIAHFKVPRYVHVTDQFPMTVTGKVQKYLMRQVSSELLGGR